VAPKPLTLPSPRVRGEGKESKPLLREGHCDIIRGSMSYNFAAIEKKWQKYWLENKTFAALDPDEAGGMPKAYILDMFPYPSGDGLHVGHPLGYTATDIVSRYRRAQGFNVLHPMGWDAFGLPAEQYAIKNNVHPAQTTRKNIEKFRQQIRMLGLSYDWDREVDTTDPRYYRWTQWIFLQLFNSYFDPIQNKAMPIAHLVQELLNERLVIGPDNSLHVNPTPHGLEAISGEVRIERLYRELSPQEQREAIDTQRLAYVDEAPVNWCPALGTVLANEEVIDGRSEVGGFPVEKRPMRQWMLRITAYADRLINDLEMLNWPESLKEMQRNWIGKSVGAEVDFDVAGASGDDPPTISVFTTRPDTLFGATYVVLAPEHPLVDEISTAAQRNAIAAYRQEVAARSERDRMADAKVKVGVFTGAYAINPVNKEQIPIWIADYVLMGYGTGAIMAVPAHDQRDYEFARQNNLPIRIVVRPAEGKTGPVDAAYVDYGIAINSGLIDGLPTLEAKEKIINWLEDEGVGHRSIKFKLRDWLFSRQRYWGEPFPLLFDEQGNAHAMSESELPLELPVLQDFKPTGSPQGPLSKVTDWMQVTTDQGLFTRETNTMPQWAGSCWYYLRYIDPTNAVQMIDPVKEKYWMPVDLYVGGVEHAVLHLLYARFWHKVLFDLGHVSTPEPFARLVNQGLILGDIEYHTVEPEPRKVDESEVQKVGDAYCLRSDPSVKVKAESFKMSKSRNNVVNPDDIVANYGADSFRLYEMYMGPLEAQKPWNTRDISGMSNFLRRVWRHLIGDEETGHKTRISDGPIPDALDRMMHRTIKKVGQDIEMLRFNTAIAELIKLNNEMTPLPSIPRSLAETFTLMLAPFAPHIAEEMWERIGHHKSLTRRPWPIFDESKLAESTMELPVQVNGKLRDKITVAADATESLILETAAATERVMPYLQGKTIRKKLYVPGKLVSFVVN
jgi:leucyl-tRNA synthetase